MKIKIFFKDGNVKVIQNIITLSYVDSGSIEPKVIITKENGCELFKKEEIRSIRIIFRDLM